MTAYISKTEPKEVFFLAYTHLTQLENALKHLNNEELIKFEISVVGNFEQFNLDRHIARLSDGQEISEHNGVIKTYWKETYGSMAYASLFNPQFGNIFIVGNLASTFLYKIDGKTLGMLSAGPDGIFRGIGASEEQVKINLKNLDIGNYLLIFRGIGGDLEDYKRLLEEG